MEVLLDYSLIVIFFVALFGLILVISNYRPTAESEEAQAQKATASLQRSGLVYGLIALLFVLLFAAAIFVERDHT